MPTFHVKVTNVGKEWIIGAIAASQERAMKAIKEMNPDVDILSCHVVDWGEEDKYEGPNANHQ